MQINPYFRVQNMLRPSASNINLPIKQVLAGTSAASNPAVITSFASVPSGGFPACYPPLSELPQTDEEALLYCNNLKAAQWARESVEMAHELAKTRAETPLSDAEKESVLASIAAEQARRAEPKPEIQLVIYENDSVAYGLLKAIDRTLGEIAEAYIKSEGYIRAQENANGKVIIYDDGSDWETFKATTDYDKLDAMYQALMQADENGRNALHQIGDMLTQGGNATTNMPNATAEERAMQHEAVVRIASEMADSYGFSEDAKDAFMASVYHHVGKDSAVNAGIAKLRSDVYKSIQFIETPQHSWSGFLRDNVNEETRRELEKVLQRPIDLKNLDKTTLDDMLFVIGYNDYGLRQEMFSWAFMNNSLAENTRANFDFAISDDKFASVNQWQNDMRDWLGQF